MVKGNSSASVGQDVAPLFQVVLIDAKGRYHSNIGYQFHKAGAKKACDGWNSQPERELSALVLSAEVDPRTPNRAFDKPTVRRLSVMTGKAQQYLLPTFCTDDDLEFYRDLLADAEQVDIVTDCAVRENDTVGDFDNKAPSDAIHALGQDFDSDIESDHEHAAGANVAYDLEATVRSIRAGGIREALKVHLQQVIDSLDHVFDCGDVGVIARSLEAFSEAMGAASEYSSGADGGWVNEELIEALGLESEKVPA